MLLGRKERRAVRTPHGVAVTAQARGTTDPAGTDQPLNPTAASKVPMLTLPGVAINAWHTVILCTQRGLRIRDAAFLRFRAVHSGLLVS